MNGMSTTNTDPDTAMDSKRSDQLIEAATQKAARITELMECRKTGRGDAVLVVRKLGCVEEFSPQWLEYGIVCTHDDGIFCECRMEFLIKAIERA